MSCGWGSGLAGSCPGSGRSGLRCGRLRVGVDPRVWLGLGQPVSPVVREAAVVVRRVWLAARPAWVAPGWYGIDVRPEVAALLRLEPGPGLAAALAGLAEGREGPCPHRHSGGSPPGEPAPGSAAGYPCACQVVAAAGWEAVAGWAGGQAAAQVVAAAGPAEVRLPGSGPVPGLRDPAKEELAAALRISPVSAGNRISAARALAGRPALARAVAAGGCSLWTARSLLAEVDALEGGEADAVIAGVLGKVGERHSRGLRPWTPGEVLAAARRLRLRLFPGSAGRAAARARSGRTVAVHGRPGVSSCLCKWSRRGHVRWFGAVARGR